MTYLRIFSALLIIGAALYWFINPDSNTEPVIVIIGSCVGLIVSFKDLASKGTIKDDKKDSSAPVSIKLTTQNVRCYKEWVDYGLQLNFEIFLNKKVILKDIYLDYKEQYGFGESWSKRAKIYTTKLIDDDLLMSDLETVVNQIKNQDKIPDLPKIFEEKSMLQVTIGGFIPGERLPDGWEGITLSNWSLILEFNESDRLKMDLTLTPHCKSEKRPTEWEYVGFANA